MAFFCINRNSKEFKDLQNDLLDLFDDDLVEFFVFKYQNSEAGKEYARQHNGEPPFPTKHDVIAMARGAAPSLATNEDIRIWAEKYSRMQYINESTKNGFYGVRRFDYNEYLDKYVNQVDDDHFDYHVYKNRLIAIPRPTLSNSDLLMYFLDKLNIIHHFDGRYYITRRELKKDNKSVPKIKSYEDTIKDFREKLAMLNIDERSLGWKSIGDEILIYPIGEYHDYNSKSITDQAIRLYMDGDSLLYNPYHIYAEMMDIKRKAIADGTFMKAPNGKDSNLNERLWLQVRTKNFINWFGDWINDSANASKVVDENGEPLVVYRTDDEKFDTFDRLYIGTSLESYFGKGFYFTPSIEYAMIFPGSVVRGFFLNARNQYQTENPDELDSMEKSKDSVNWMKQEGKYDELVVFDPNLIKSADENIGSFSTYDDNIYHEQEFNKTNGVTDNRLRSLYEQSEDGNVSLSDIVSIILNSEFSSVVDLLKKISEGHKEKLLLEVKVKLIYPLDFWGRTVAIRELFQGRRAYYNASNKTIYVNIESNFANGDSSSVLMHEILHAVTVDRILNNSELRKEFQTIIDNYNDQLKSGVPYFGKHAVEEFIADVWSNKTTINNLKKFKAAKKVSLWDRIKQFFKNVLFGNAAEDSMFAEASDKLYQLLEMPAYDIKLMSDTRFFENEQKNDKIQLTQYELKLIEQRKALIESNALTGALLNDYAKIFTFQLSNMISELQEDMENNLYYFTEDSPFYNTDFTNMTRFEIMQTIGSGVMFNILKEKYFNFENNINAESMPKEMHDKVRAKLDAIYNNFDAFIETAMASLCDLELVSFDGARVVNDGSDLVFQDENSALEAAEIFGSSIESWQIGFRLISAVNSLSQIIKRSLSYISKTDEDGDEALTEEGLPILENLTDITTHILAWTLGASDIYEMIDLLYNHIDEASWVLSIINKLENGDETYKSQFFSNFCKYFLPYIILYYDSKDGVMVQKVINRQQSADMLYNEFLSNIQTITDEHITNDKESPIPVYKWDNKEQQMSVNKFHFDLFKQACKVLYEYKSRKEGYTEDQIQEVRDALEHIMNALGFNVDDNKISQITEDYAENESSKEFTKLFRHIIGVRDNILSPGRNDLKKIFEALGEDLGSSAESVSYEAGKLHYSYVTPSWLGLFMNDLRGINVDNDQYQDWIEDEFGRFPWFCKRNAEGSEYSFRNYWLRQLYENPELRKEIEHAVILSSKDKNAKEEIGYTDKSPLSYTRSILQAYFYADEKGKPSKYAYFRIPIMSNKPSEEYIKFIKITGDNYEDIITKEFIEVAHQEMDRMATVLSRKKNGDSKISNFDKMGSKFLFLDFILDAYELDDEFRLMVDLHVNSLANDNGASVMSNLDAKLRDIIKSGMSKKFNEFLNYLDLENIINNSNQKNPYANLKDLKMGKTALEIENNLRNFFWNDTLASINILQLTITDKAFYKNDEDLQKRLALIHSPGLRGNLSVKDRYGNLVFNFKNGKAKMRTLYLLDFSDVVSDAINNVKAIFKHHYDKLIEEGKLKEAERYKDVSDSIIEQFEKINVTDAQGYTSLTGYRKKALAFGKWSDELEDMYQAVKRGDYEYVRNKAISIQPSKPFVYTLITKQSSGVLDTLRVGHQNKNSEYLLFIMDAIILGDLTGIAANCKLKAISEVMEESAQGRWEDDHYIAGTNGIDTIQFESTVKTGLQGVVNINDDAIAEYILTHDDADSLSNTEIVKRILRDAMYSSNGLYNENNVHEYNAKDYSYQSEVPAHLEGESIMGSLLRILAVSDLDLYDQNGNPNTVMIDGKIMTISDARKAYMNAIVDNIRMQSDLLREKLGINYPDKKSRNIALSRLLQDEIRRDSRYGYDLLFSVCTDENGNFNMPLSDPIQSARILQLLNSMIKKYVNKQEIEGGPAVLVSNFGTAKKLNIKFKDRDGNILLTRSEYESMEHEDGKTFDLYIEENQGSIAYFECYAPSTIFREFADENGYIDIDRIPKDMLEMIGYRIPTEAKYSMAPLKIVGLLPYEAGEGIMLPYEITLLSGSDFDIDKLYLIRRSMMLDYEKALQDFKQDKKDLWEDVFEAMPGSKDALYNAKAEYEKTGDWDSYKQYKQDLLDRYIEQEGNSIYMIKDGEEVSFKDWLDEKRKYGEHGMYFGRNVSRKGQNDNVIFSTIWGVLTDTLSAELIMHPGNFDEPKKYGYISAILDKLAISHEYKYTYKELKEKSVDELKLIVGDSKNIVFIYDHLAFHKQNMVAGKLIGIFAQNNVSHSIVSMTENTTINIPEWDIVDIAGIRIGGREESYDNMYNRYGDRISSVLALFLAASVDAVKDPVLNYMNINETTAGIVTTMARLGFDIETIMLFLTLKIIKDTVDLYNVKTEGGKYASMDLVIDQIADKYELLSSDSRTFKDEMDDIEAMGLTKDILLKTRDGIADDVDNAQVLMAFLRMYEISRATSDIGALTRFNSVAAAVGPKISDTLVLKDKLRRAKENQMLQTPTMIIALSNPIIKEFLEQSFGLFSEIFHENFLQASPNFQHIFDYISDLIPGNLDEKTANKLIEFYIAYISNIYQDPETGKIKARSLFGGNTFSAFERNRMMNKFVPTVRNLRKKFNGNAFVDRIEIKTPDRRHLRLWININTRGLERQEIDKLQLSWYDLYKSGDEGKLFALDLAKYEFFVNGFGFSPLTFSNLMPVQLKSLIQNYIKNLEESNGSVGDEQQFEIFIDQFFRNNHSDLKLVEVIYSADKQKNGDITLSISRPYVKFMGKLYKQYNSVEGFLGIKTYFYKEVEPLGGDNEFLEINPGYDIQKSVVSIKEEDRLQDEQDGNRKKDGVKSKFQKKFDNYKQAFTYFSNEYKKYEGQKLSDIELLGIKNRIYDSLIDAANKWYKDDQSKGKSITNNMVKKMMKELNLC